MVEDLPEDRNLIWSINSNNRKQVEVVFLWRLKCPMLQFFYFFIIFLINGSSDHLVCRKCGRRTMRWRCWWTRWGTCCGTSTPCWPSGNDAMLRHPKAEGTSCLRFERGTPSSWCAGSPSPKVTSLCENSKTLAVLLTSMLSVGRARRCNLHWMTSHTPALRIFHNFCKWQLTSVFVFLFLPDDF